MAFKVKVKVITGLDNGFKVKVKVKVQGQGQGHYRVRQWVQGPLSDLTGWNYWLNL